MRRAINDKAADGIRGRPTIWHPRTPTPPKPREHAIATTTGPTLVDKPAMRFIGIEAAFIHIRSPDANSGEVIGPLWNDFLGRMEAIEQRLREDALFGVIYGKPEAERSHKHELQYIACALVSEDAPIPEGMVEHRVPAAQYACFTHRGPITEIKESCDAVYDGWLPGSGYKHAEVADIELYDERFQMEDCDNSEMEYWISIRRKSDNELSR